MAVEKTTSPWLRPAAPRGCPAKDVPSASTSRTLAVNRLDLPLLNVFHPNARLNSAQRITVDSYRISAFRQILLIRYGACYLNEPDNKSVR